MIQRLLSEIHNSPEYHVLEEEEEEEEEQMIANLSTSQVHIPLKHFWKLQNL
jgi:hypothetical protein